MKKIITIIGARPQIIKAAAISRAIKTSFGNSIQEIVLHTGQHYDHKMSGNFFLELQMALPTYQFSVSNPNQGGQTAEMMSSIESVILKEKPDGVLVYGDTNSTLAGALVAAKLNIPLIHVEAGLRSFNKKMPEEINRITTDHCSDLLFSPTAEGVINLISEGIKHEVGRQEVYHCGDIMFDNSLYYHKVALEKSNVLEDNNLSEGEFNLVTIHRPSNTDDEIALKSILEALRKVQKIDNKQIVLPLHPRTKKMIVQFFGEAYLEKISEDWKVIPPVSFLDMILLESSANAVITDSGGVQKEAYFFKKKSIILREETEWVEIINNNGGVLTGSDGDKIIEAYKKLDLLDCTFEKVFGDGNAAEFICDKILKVI